MTRRTKRRFAHELYPLPGESEVRPLVVEVPCLYARAVGFEVWGTDWHDLRGTPELTMLTGLRIVQLTQCQMIALMADALLQGMTGDDAWTWANERASDETGEIVFDRAGFYGVPVGQIKPYPVLAEARKHYHWSDPDVYGISVLVATVDCPESECVDCTEPVEEVTP
ncbi:MAG: hypothetical protein LBI33_12760 [Propionibacteriaceae bacterium]|jgi:hypothetical protein|nr:hypothetical protein [Propionibacteriaceae bacterium]